MVKLLNRAKMATASTGTAGIILAGAVSGFQTFASAGATEGDVLRYVIEDGTAWEIGVGVYSATGPTLSRTLLQSSTGSLLNLSGAAQVYVSAAADDLPTITGPTGALQLPASTTANRPTAAVGLIRYNTTTGLFEAYDGAWKNIPLSATMVLPATNGQQLWNNPGTYTWVCPAGVNFVNALAIGGGGGALRFLSTYTYGQGGGGGGLGWLNNIPVIPGNSYTVVVGVGGTGVTTTSTTTRGGNGGDSYFISAATVSGKGGQGGGYSLRAPGGSYVGDGGGNGGYGGTSNGSTVCGGGGGAGGYTGSGGDGGIYSGAYTSATAGVGGGGGGGGYSGGANGGGGGGTGAYGVGTNGAAGAGYNTATNALRGGGGSSGIGGTATAVGGLFGGGSTAGQATYDSGVGGCVRLIWGPNRAFPSTNTADM